MRATRSKSAHIKKRRSPIGVVLAIGFFVAAVIAAVFVYVFTAQTYNSGVAEMRDGVESATKDVLIPMGGIEHRAVTVENGELSDSFLCIDMNCPDVQTQWYLLADKGQEAVLKQRITEAISQKSKDAKWSVSVIVGVLGNNERPYDASVGREWFNISIFVTYASK